MQNLLYFLFRYGYVLIFIILELLSLNLVVRYNPHQHDIFIKSSNNVSGWLLKQYQGVTQYFSLAKVAAELAEENAELLSKTRDFQRFNSVGSLRDTVQDTVRNQQYVLLPAKVVANTITGLDNYITIDRGTEAGVEEGMGLILKEGIVGVITDVNRKFARAISILHRDCRISASVARNQFFGTLNWQGNDPRFAKLIDIPKHADLKTGDQIVTSGYSAIFPQGISLGKITHFSLEDGSNFYDVDVQLAMDLSKLDYVYIVKNLLKEEQLQLEKAEQ